MALQMSKTDLERNWAIWFLWMRRVWPSFLCPENYSFSHFCSVMGCSVVLQVSPGVGFIWSDFGVANARVEQGRAVGWEWPKAHPGLLISPPRTSQGLVLTEPGFPLMVNTIGNVSSEAKQTQRPAWPCFPCDLGLRCLISESFLSSHPPKKGDNNSCPYHQGGVRINELMPAGLSADKELPECCDRAQQLTGQELFTPQLIRGSKKPPGQSRQQP